MLDWLRLQERATGTKEGCAEGDCGACAVVVVRERDGRLVYEPLNSCITLLGQLEGAELITVEDLAEDGVLHPVQEAMARQHGSQCGFCTPGIVMSLFAHYHECGGVSSRDKLNDVLAGNLCRCTGYRPIVDAALEVCSLGADDQFTRNAAARRNAVRALDDKADLFVGDAASFFAAPASEQSLARLYAQHPDATIVAGATDVGLWITKKLTPLEKIIHVGRVAELSGIEQSAERLCASARSFRLARAAPVLGSIDPDIAEVLRRFGSFQVRAAGTVGGNIANGSPIGDLRADADRARREGGIAPRRSRSRIAAGEFLSSTTASRIASLENSCAGCWCRHCRPPRTFAPTRSPSAPTRIFPRCSRRFASTSTAAGSPTLRSPSAAWPRIPKRAKAVEESLRGLSLADTSRWHLAAEAVAKDFTPLTDLRASASYRSRVAGNLVIKAIAEMAGVGANVTRIADHRIVADAAE